MRGLSNWTKTNAKAALSNQGFSGNCGSAENDRATWLFAIGAIGNAVSWVLWPLGAGI
jgi:hypothetical protein